MMRTYRSFLPTALLLVGVLMNSAMAGDEKEVVQTFYDFLSNPASEEHAAALNAVTSDDWQSIGDYSGAHKTSEEFNAQVGGFGKLIPDLTWAVQEMIQAGNQVVVRSRATGTPTGPLFGVDGKGKSFDILTIDIHTITNGKIVRTYHVEDWAGALRQLNTQ